jgi:hypothetical protein
MFTFLVNSPIESEHIFENTDAEQKVNILMWSAAVLDNVCVRQLIICAAGITIGARRNCDLKSARKAGHMKFTVNFFVR